MAYDERLAERVRTMLKRRSGVSERKMFGGICFMINGNMCCGIDSRDLMLRLGKDGVTAALEEPHARPFDITGKPMKTMCMVSPKGHQGDEALKAWLSRAITYARSLPPKSPSKSTRVLKR